MKSCKLSFSLPNLEEPHYSFNYDEDHYLFNDLREKDVVVVLVGNLNTVTLARVVSLSDSPVRSKKYFVRQLIGRVDRHLLVEDRKQKLIFEE